MHSLSKTTPIYAMLMISLLFAAPLSAQDKGTGRVKLGQRHQRQYLGS